MRQVKLPTYHQKSSLSLGGEEKNTSLIAQMRALISSARGMKRLNKVINQSTLVDRVEICNHTLYDCVTNSVRNERC
jgi:hypothetical protein